MDITANYHGGADTSVAAYRSTPESVRIANRHLILDKIFELGSATSNELEILLQKTHQSVSPRITELAKMGSIIDTGERRLTLGNKMARVYKLNPLMEIHYKILKAIEDWNENK